MWKTPPFSLLQGAVERMNIVSIIDFFCFIGTLRKLAIRFKRKYI